LQTSLPVQVLLSLQGEPAGVGVGFTQFAFASHVPVPVHVPGAVQVDPSGLFEMTEQLLDVRGAAVWHGPGVGQGGCVGGAFGLLARDSLARPQTRVSVATAVRADPRRARGRTTRIRPRYDECREPDKET
jgi:hypothetical protein